MEISLYHRLVGMWTGLGDRLRGESELATLAAIVQAVLVQFGMEDGTALMVEMTDQPLLNGLLLLPVMLDGHDDPLYLGDRLATVTLPAGHLAVIQDLAQLVSGCLRERFTAATLGDWYSRQGLLRERWQEVAAARTWQQFRVKVQGLGLEATEQQLLQVVGAIATGGGQWQMTLALVAAGEPLVQLWVALLLGGLRGDRQLPLTVLQQQDLAAIHQHVRQFWSRWSGLPLRNQLQLDQIPLVASGQVLQYRPALKLLSQHHLI